MYVWRFNVYQALKGQDINIKSSISWTTLQHPKNALKGLTSFHNIFWNFEKWHEENWKKSRNIYLVFYF